MVRVNEQDLETQVRDLQFAVARARQLPFVSQDKLAVMGLDMGGMAALLLAMRNPDVGAFVGSACGGFCSDILSGLPRIFRRATICWRFARALAANLSLNGGDDAAARVSITIALLMLARYSNFRHMLLTPKMDHLDLTYLWAHRGARPSRGGARV